MARSLPLLLALAACTAADETGDLWVEEGPPAYPNLCRVSLACDFAHCRLNQKMIGRIDAVILQVLLHPAKALGLHFHAHQMNRI